MAAKWWLLLHRHTGMELRSCVCVRWGEGQQDGLRGGQRENGYWHTCNPAGWNVFHWCSMNCPARSFDRKVCESVNSSTL